MITRISNIMSTLLQNFGGTQNEKDSIKARSTGKLQKEKDFESSNLDLSYNEGDSVLNPSAMSFPLTENCHHYTHRSEVDWDIQKLVRFPIKSGQSNFCSDTGHNVTAYSHSTMKEYI
jgi:hypothetical protein